MSQTDCQFYSLVYVHVYVNKHPEPIMGNIGIENVYICIIFTIIISASSISTGMYR